MESTTAEAIRPLSLIRAGAVSRDIPSNGGVVRISNYGFVRQFIPGPGGDAPSSGREKLDAAAGMVDGTFPFGKQIREGIFGKMGVDTGAPEYQNTSAISGGVTTGLLLLTGAGEAELAEEGTTTLYRAVGDAEFEQIMRTGTFEAGPNSMAFGKHFADFIEWHQSVYEICCKNKSK